MGARRVWRPERVVIRGCGGGSVVGVVVVGVGSEVGVGGAGGESGLICCVGETEAKAALSIWWISKLLR